MTVHDGMTDELHPQLRHSLGIPRFFEGEDAQKQIIILRHSIGAARARSPNLRGNVLDNLGAPIVEPAGTSAHILLDAMSKAAIEPGEIHANNCVWLAVQRQVVKTNEEPPEVEVVFQHAGQADD